MFVRGLRCMLCGAEYAVGEVEYVCPKHGDEGILDVLYDYEAIRQVTSPARIAEDPDVSIARYAAVLPIRDRGSLPPVPVGGTPVYHARRLGRRLGLPHLYVKDDGRNPSASFKDRASAVGVARARELGKRVMTGASTGNAAASLALLTASVGIRSIIFVPETAPRAKIAQLLIHGATVLAVRGSYDEAYDLCLEATRRFGWYNRNTGYNPYLSEGKKSAAFEIAEQFTAIQRWDLPALLGHRGGWARGPEDVWDPPDWIFVSVGDGCIIGGLGKGILDMAALGWISHTPRLMGVQAEGSAAIYRAWKAGTDVVEPVHPTTLADSISVGKPRDALKALRAVRETKGGMVLVSDAEILEAMKWLGRDAAVFAEPAGAAAFAGVIKALEEGWIGPKDRILVLVTGNGLKDVGAAIRATGEPLVIEPTLEAVQEAVERLGLDVTG